MTHQQTARTPEHALQKTYKRLGRIAQSVARAEQSNEILWAQCRSYQERIKELEAEIETLRPRVGTKWGWLTWSLNRPEVARILIKAPENEAERKRHGNRMRCRLTMGCGHHIYVKTRERAGLWYYEVIKGKRWSSFADQINQRGDGNEEADQATEE